MNADREAQIDHEIVEAYTRLSQEEIWGTVAARLLVEAEPWD
jgi:3'-phosphoadenosine 5'-phosphosulfate (PAPS) 3'-phosphatase